MIRLSEFTPQTVIGSMQSVVVVGGTLATSMGLKIGGYPDARSVWPPASVFVRESGFLLLLIPAIWVLATVALELRCPDWFSKRWTIGSGVVLLLILVSYLTMTAAAGTGMAGSIISNAE